MAGESYISDLCVSVFGGSRRSINGEVVVEKSTYCFDNIVYIHLRNVCPFSLQYHFYLY